LAEEEETIEVGQPIAIIETDAEAAEEATASEDNADDNETASGQDKSPSDEGAKDADDGERIEVEMPQMGESVMEGTVIEWSKEIGDKVDEVEKLLDNYTDKVDSEVYSTHTVNLGD